MSFEPPGRPSDRPHKRRIRVIPTLLLDGRGRLVKTVQFAKPYYIGDPINAVRIFNQKEVDELVLLDIDASREGREPNYRLIEEIVSEAFMPVGYGGGIGGMQHVERLFACGIEKVILSSCLRAGMGLVSEASRRYGGQAIVVCLPVKRGLFGKQRVRVMSGAQALGNGDIEAIARAVVASGAGEIIVYDVDREGTYRGYDLMLLKRIASAVDVPVVACGGASSLEDFRAAAGDAGCSAVAAGSLFVFQAQRRGVLITYPSQHDLTQAVFETLD